LLNDERVDRNKTENSLNMTPFYIACQRGQNEIVRLLLNDQRVDVNRKNDLGEAPFYVACEKGQTDVVRMLLDNKRVETNVSLSDGVTPLFIACQNGHIEVVQHILANERELDINKKCHNTLTALDISKERSNSIRKFNLETEEEFQKAKKNCPIIVVLLESFQKNPNEIRTKLRKQLGLPRTIFSFLFFLFFFFFPFSFSFFFFISLVLF